MGNKVDRTICRPVTKRECNPVVEVVPVVEIIQKKVSETVCAPPAFSLDDPLTQGNNDSNDNGSNVDSEEDNAIDYSNDDSEEDDERDSSFDDSENQSSMISNLLSFFNR